MRFTDHAPFFFAQKEGYPFLIIYCFEPSIMEYDDSDVRHWRFVYQSLQEMKLKVKEQQYGELYIFHNEALNIFENIAKEYKIHTIFSHQETGNKITYDRDLVMQHFCKTENIIWKEYQTNGVIRKLKHRSTWDAKRKTFMEASPKIVEENNWNLVKLSTQTFNNLKGEELSKEIMIPHKNFQIGGETLAWRYLDSFLKNRYLNYSKHISKPELSRKSCSRLSPYLTYGNISMRMVIQYTLQNYANATNKMALSNFLSRLHWHCHFIQKFEDECSMEFKNVNNAYDALEKPVNEIFINAWQKGVTGVPLVDACMRCLVATGYINFRMRAMVVSFFTFNLWQDWRELHFLAKQFLDYEPGIHYPQLQMQAGVTGVNTIRIYSPTKNAIDHDADAVFIKKWLPELNNIPSSLVYEPWKLSEIEQEMYGCIIGKNYPAPIVDIETSRKAASDIVWSFRKTKAVKNEGQRILEKHTHRKTSKEVVFAKAKKSIKQKKNEAQQTFLAL